MTTRAVSVGPVAGMLATAGDYFKLTKPRVISLLLVTTAAAMFVAAQGVPDGWLLLWTMVGGYLAAGGAGAINHYVDRDIDAYMGRTTGRPWWAGRVQPARALAFGIGLGALACWCSGSSPTGSPRSCPRRTGHLRGRLHAVAQTAHVPQHRHRWVGRRGAALVGWAAVTGDLGLQAWILFASSSSGLRPTSGPALLLKRDYTAAGVPMLPVVRVTTRPSAGAALVAGEDGGEPAPVAAGGAASSTSSPPWCWVASSACSRR